VTQRNLSASTTPGSMPGYVSVNFTPQTDDPKCSAFVTIDVRGHARERYFDGPMDYGPTARVVLTVEEFSSLLARYGCTRTR